MQKLRDAAAFGVESEIWAWSDRCQMDVGTNYPDWKNISGGCAVPGLGAKIASDALKAANGGPACAARGPTFYCYTQNKYYKLGDLGPPGTGVCRGPSNDGAACSCGESLGTVQRYASVGQTSKLALAPKLHRQLAKSLGQR
jgi:hypothetical protein